MNRLYRIAEDDFIFGHARFDLSWPRRGLLT